MCGQVSIHTVTVLVVWIKGHMTTFISFECFVIMFDPNCVTKTKLTTFF